ncbi:hypothetical protein SAMN06296386_103201 [Lachnospiraceae bacterium]|nr:hypothetical protein SAMN06296386_103201 [Lachnospiraceae bacterium]
MNKEFIKRNRWIIGGFLILFVGLFLYFTYAHPLVIFDTDDWNYVGEPRHAIPGFGRGIWNPIKVFPEILQCLISELGVCFIMPFTKDFFLATSYAYAVFGSLMILGFFVVFLRFIDKKLHMNTFRKLLVLGLAVSLFFLTFVSKDTGNVNLFSENNLTCFFNYTVPAVLNMGMVLFFMTDGITDLLDRSVSFSKRAVVFVLCYLCICSNLCESYFLAIYLGQVILFDILRDHRDVKKIVRRNRTPIILFLGWILSLGLELSGGRSAQVGNTNMAETLPLALGYFVNRFAGSNVWVVIAVAVIVMISLTLLLRDMKKQIKLISGRCFWDLLRLLHFMQ